MAPKKTVSIEDKRKAKRDCERRRRAKIKADPNKYAEAKLKEKERRQRRKDEKKILNVNDLTPRQQRLQRKEWRERARKSRLKRKLSERALRAVRDFTPSTDSEIDDQIINRVSPSIIREDTPQPIANTLANTTPTHRQLREVVLQHTPITISRESSCASDTQYSSRASPASMTRQKIQGMKQSRRIKDLRQTEVRKQEIIMKKQNIVIENLKRQIRRLKTLEPKPAQIRIRQTIIRDRWALKKSSIRNFLEDDENSMLSPAIKDQITRKGIKKQKRFLCDSLYNLHVKYNEKSPRGLQVSYASFCRLRPFWIVRAKLTDRDTCLCVFHENYSMMVERLRSLNILLDKDIVSRIVCSPSSYKCMARLCNQCKNRLPEIRPFHDDYISYQQWASVTEERMIHGRIKKIRRTIKDRIQCTKKDLVEKFVDTVPKYLIHKFNIYNQYKTVTHIKDNLQLGELLLKIDFSENYACKYFSEAQGVHFGASRDQISIHTGVLYFYSEALKKVDSISFCSVSPCLRHDASAVFAHLKKSLMQLTKDQNITALHISSDGPSSQYKNKSNIFLFTQYLVNILNLLEASWNFTETSHGKGPADGVGAAVKETANNYVRRGNDIPNYGKFVEVIKRKCNVLVYEVTEEEVKEGDNLLRSVKINNLPGTKTMHQFTWARALPTIINMRKLTCIDCGIKDICEHYNIGWKEIVKSNNKEENEASYQKELREELTNNIIQEELRDNIQKESTDNTITIGSWVVVEYKVKLKYKHFVGQVTEVKGNEFTVTFLKLVKDSSFTWPENPDIDMVHAISIKELLPEPSMNRRAQVIFKNISPNYNLE